MIAIKKTRAKRIASIYKRFPSLKTQAKNQDENSNPNVDDPMDEEDEENTKEQPLNKKKKLEKLKL